MNYEIHLRPKGEKNGTRVNIYQRYGLTRAGGSGERAAAEGMREGVKEKAIHLRFSNSSDYSHSLDPAKATVLAAPAN